MADMTGPLPSVSELAERIGRHQREMLDWAEGRRTHSPQGWRGELTPAMAEANRQEVLMRATMVQVELALLNFVMPRYVVSKDGEPAEYWTGPEWAQFRGYRSW